MNSNKIGQRGEEKAKERLLELGFLMIEKVENAWKVARNKGGSISRAWPAAKVAGDFRAVEPPFGRSVLVEVKHTGSRNLRWSDFSEHQPIKLSEHSAAGGLSLVAWVVNEGAVYVMRWPIDEALFRKGKSLKREDAEKSVYYHEDDERLDFS